MADEKTRPIPEDGPNGVDRWTSNGYGLHIDGIEVNPPEKEDDYGNQTEEHEADER